MKNKKKILSPFKRKIHIDGREWSYQIKKSKYPDSSGYIRICNPSNTKKFQIKIETLGKSGTLQEMEWCPEEFDGEWDEVYSVSITPSIVKELILSEIIKNRDNFNEY